MVCVNFSCLYVREHVFRFNEHRYRTNTSDQILSTMLLVIFKIRFFVDMSLFLYSITFKTQHGCYMSFASKILYWLNVSSVTKTFITVVPKLEKILFSLAYFMVSAII